MNRRNFIAGLLATTAAVPLAADLRPGMLPGEVLLRDNPYLPRAYALRLHEGLVELDGFDIFRQDINLWSGGFVAVDLRPGMTLLDMIKMRAALD